jgi:hypothetical protein
MPVDLASIRVNRSGRVDSLPVHTLSIIMNLEKSDLTVYRPAAAGGPCQKPGFSPLFSLFI